MIYGIDIDDTLTNTSEVENRLALEFAKQRGITIKIDKNEYFSQYRYGFTPEQDVEFWDECSATIYAGCRVFEGAAKLIQGFKHRGDEVHILTGRNAKFSSITEETLRVYGVPFDSIHYGLSRKDVCAKKLHLDVMFEDAEDYSLGLIGVVPNIFVKEIEHNAHLKALEELKFFTDWSKIDL